MERVNLQSFYDLGSILHPFTSGQEESTIGQILVRTLELRTNLQNLLEGRPIKLRNEQPVQALLDAIAQATENPEKVGFEEWWDIKIDAMKLYNISNRASRLEIILSNEFPLFHSYLIAEEGLESVDTLIQNPQNAFNLDTIKLLETITGTPLEDFNPPPHDFFGQ